MPEKLNKKQFIDRSNTTHNNKFDYSKTEYINSSTKVCIICPEHGEFWQRPSDHMRGIGCSECSGVKKMTTKTFIEKSQLIYGDKYDYSKVVYVGNKIKICIICKEHGEFWQRPNDHLTGYECIKCANKYAPTTEEFIEKAKLIHGDKYDYSKVKYVKALESVCIICPIHGEFWQRPNNHLNGNNCPACNSGKKSKLEENISVILDNNNISYKREKSFIWLKYKSYLFLDFYLSKYNLAIEVQGEQHFVPIKRFGGEDGFKLRQIRDKYKYDLCLEHGINIFYITKKMNNINELLNILNNETTK